MKPVKNRRKTFFANKIHGEIFLLVFWASIVPTVIVGILLYYLIFYMIAEQMGIPEAIAYNILPAVRRVTAVVAVCAPACILTIMIFTHRIAHTIIGPFNRIIRELDEHLAGTRQGPITLRQGDRFLPLVERINKLLEKRQEGC